ncbi:cytochrome b5 [Apiospora rasikravindrae]|uniref:Cytochrome b5 n=1 Tax=Apiospora rasikravindrae TaxID=990691 RepID=A0ABR1U0F0_9PEZI
MIAWILTPWPGRSSAEKYGGYQRDLPNTEEARAAPLLWVSALLSEKFWSTEVSKHGSRSLLMPKLCKTTRHFKVNSRNPWMTSRAETVLEVETPLDSLRERLRTTALDFNVRAIKWADRHPCAWTPLPRGWHDSLAETVRQLERARQGNPAFAPLMSWAPFDIKVPPYDDRWQAWDLVPGGGSMIRVIVDADGPKMKSIAQLMETRGEELRKQLDEQAQAFLAKNPQGVPLPHLTVTEVGAHREAGDAWIVFGQNNNTYNVYDVTAALKELQWTTAQFREVTRVAEYGLEMRTGPHVQNVAAGNAFLGTFNRWKLLGKLMVPMLPKAVLENDGTGGMPLYKTYGKHVFDLTSFACPPHWQEILLSNPGGPIDETRPGFYPEMISVIAKHRCGYIMDPPSAPRPDADLTPFTERTLRVYDNPRSGLYYAVDGFVYDMTSYLEMHPGGLASLKEWAGQDASAIFAKWHDKDMLSKSPYDSLRIGRMVSEIPADQVQAHHLVLDKWVYDITVPAEGDASGLFRDLQDIGGSDATDLLEDEDTSDAGRAALATLKADYQSRIVHRLRETQVAQVMFDELAARDDPEGAGAWVAIGDNVWDVTSIMLQPEWYPRKIDRKLAGKVLGQEAKEDEKWLLGSYPHLLVAKLDLAGLTNMSLGP